MKRTALLLSLIVFCAQAALAQRGTSQIDTITFQNSGTTVGTAAAPFKLNFSGCTVAKSGGTFTVTCSGSGGNVTGPGSATANSIPTFADTTGKLLGSSSITDNGTTVVTTEAFSTLGVTTGAGGSAAGFFDWIQGTAHVPTANSFSIFAPTSIATAFGWTPPTAENGTAGVLHLGAAASHVSPMTVSKVVSTDVDSTICSNAACGQNTTGTAANVSGTPALPNGTTGTTQAANSNDTKLATDAYSDAHLPAVTYNTQVAARNTALGVTTMVASAPAGACYKFNYDVKAVNTGTGCTGTAGNVYTYLQFTDADNAVAINLYVRLMTDDGASTIASNLILPTNTGTITSAMMAHGISYSLCAATGSAVTFSTAYTNNSVCTTQVNYVLNPILEKVR